MERSEPVSVPGIRILGLSRATAPPLVTGTIRSM
jgi:hypothetical protein